MELRDEADRLGIIIHGLGCITPNFSVKVMLESSLDYLIGVALVPKLHF